MNLSLHVYTLCLVLACSLEAAQYGEAASLDQPAQRARQNMKAKQVSPASTDAAANSTMANATPWHPAGIPGIQKPWFSSGNVIGPSHHVGLLEECVQTHVHLVWSRGAWGLGQRT